MIEKILKAFGIEGTPKVFGDGHINTTYSVDGKYVVQKINTDVFTNPAGVMQNCFLVTEFIRETARAPKSMPFRMPKETFT